MLAVIDYGAGNLRSVLHALRYLGVEKMKLVQNPDDLTGADKIILPGVGAFGAGMQKLHEQELVEPIKQHIDAGIPYLGICLGMQFLFEHSDEMGEHAGFGVLNGYVTRFPEALDCKVPHIGWNQLHIQRSSPLLKSLGSGCYSYFVHSYYCVPTDERDVIVTVDYGISFAAAVERENVFGVQFHPEKSQRVGLNILRNFLEL